MSIGFKGFYYFRKPVSPEYDFYTKKDRRMMSSIPVFFISFFMPAAGISFRSKCLSAIYLSVAQDIIYKNDMYPVLMP